MKIQFILPSPTRKPVGGYRIVYEYANRLASLGHDTVVYHVLALPFKDYTEHELRDIVKTIICKEWPVEFVPRWFGQEYLFKSVIVPAATDSYIAAGDVIFASLWATAYNVKNLCLSKGLKFYLIQHIESIAGAPEGLADSSYFLGLNNIVVSKWLSSELLKRGAPVSAYFANGIDTRLYCLKNEIEKRQPYSIAMMYHTSKWKGSIEGLRAIEKIKQEIPELKLILFSTSERTGVVPEWVEYCHLPSIDKLVEIYNNCAIFVSSSWAEGFCLPGAEAMACGCAVVTTDSGGVRDYAIHGNTAMISPIKDVVALAKNIKQVILDHELRWKMARNGNKYIQNFSWNNNIELLNRYLIEKTIIDKEFLKKFYEDNINRLKEENEKKKKSIIDEEAFLMAKLRQLGIE